MPNYKQLQTLSPEQFRRACGVQPQTFNRMVEVLAQAKAQQKPGRPSLLSLEDQLLLTLEYLREYRTYFHIAQSWGLHESTVCRIVKKIEDLLIQVEEFHLPGMKQLHQAEELALSTVVVDVTEQEIERPKKNSAVTTQARKNAIR
jgi:hypothetical protein